MFTADQVIIDIVGNASQFSGAMAAARADLERYAGAVAQVERAASQVNAASAARERAQAMLQAAQAQSDRVAAQQQRIQAEAQRASIVASRQQEAADYGRRIAETNARRVFQNPQATQQQSDAAQRAVLLAMNQQVAASVAVTRANQQLNAVPQAQQQVAQRAAAAMVNAHQAVQKAASQTAIAQANAHSAAARVIDQTSGRMSDAMRSAAGAAGNAWDGFLTKVMAVAAVVGLGGGLLGLGRDAVQMAADFQRAGIALEVMTGSAAEGKRILADLTKMALETPFQTSDLLQATKQLSAYGLTNEQLVPAVRVLGEVSAGTGTSLDRLTLAFGQVHTTGRLMGQELRQFTNAGVPLFDYLARVLEVDASKIPNMVRHGQVGFGAVTKAMNLMVQEGEKFGGMMDRINKETVSGRWENLVENVQQFGIKMATAAFEAFNVGENLTALTAFTQGADLRLFVNSVRGAFVLVREAFTRIFEGLVAAVKWVTELAVRYQNVTRVIVVSLAVYASVVVAVKAIAVAWAAVTAAVGLASAAITFLTTPLGAVLAAVTAVTVALGYLGAFDGIGDVFGKVFDDAFPDLKAGFDQVLELVRSGELEDAWKVATKGIQVVWDSLLVAMEAGWTRFVGNLRKIFSTEGGSFWGDVFKREVDLTAFFERRNPFSKMTEDQIADRVKAEYEKIDAQMKVTGERIEAETTGRMAAILEKTKSLNSLAELRNVTADAKALLQVPAGVGRDFFKAVRDNPDQIIAYPEPTAAMGGADVLDVMRRAAGAGGEYAGRLDKLVEAAVQDSDNKAAMVARLASDRYLAGGPNAGRVSPFAAQAAAVEFEYRNAAGRAASAAQELRRAVKDNRPDEEIKKLAARVDESAKAADAVLAPFRKLQDDLARMARKDIPIPLEIPQDVRTYIDKMQKELDKDEKRYEPLTNFTKKMDLISQAVGDKGVIFNDERLAAMAAVTGFALPGSAKMPRPLINRQQSDDLMFHEFEEIRKAVKQRSGDRDGGAPTTFFGTQAAQDTINKARVNARDPQQDILAVLLAAHELETQSVNYQKQTVDALKALGADRGKLQFPSGPGSWFGL